MVAMNYKEGSRASPNGPPRKPTCAHVISGRGLCGQSVNNSMLALRFNSKNQTNRNPPKPKKHMFTAAEYLVYGECTLPPPRQKKRGRFFQEEFASWQQREKRSGPFRGRPGTVSKTSLKPSGWE